MAKQMMLMGESITGKPIYWPADEAATETFGIIGMRGKGKTYTTKKIAEGIMNAGHQCIILDPLDVFWGMRSSADGKKPGFPVVIFGGDHGDLPLEGGSGQIIAKFLVESRHSAILSMRHLSKGQFRQFVTAFATEMWRLKGMSKHQQPVMLVIDEASLVVPQRIPKGGEQLYGIIDEIVRLGRRSGFGVTLVNQRTASLNKDVLSQCQTIICHQLMGKHDRKAFEGWIEDHDDSGNSDAILREVATLPKGHAWVWSPVWLGKLERISIGKLETYDSSATPTSASYKSKGPKKLAPVDLANLTEEIKAAAKRVEDESPAGMRKRIAQLEAELKKVPKQAVVEVKPAKQKPAISKGDISRIERLLNKVVASQDRYYTASDALLKLIPRTQPAYAQQLQELFNKLVSPIVTVNNQVMKPAIVSEWSSSNPSTKKKTATAPVGVDVMELGNYALDILRVAVDRSPIPTNDSMLAALSGKSLKSSAFAPNLRKLEAAGLIARSVNPPGWVATDAAVSQYGSDHNTSVMTVDERKAYWLGRLPSYEASVLRAVLQYGALSIDGISEHTGKSKTSSAFMPAIRNLVSLEFLVESAGLYVPGNMFVE